MIVEKTPEFRTYLNEYDGLWYIVNSRNQKVRIRTAGKDTGINKSWCSKSTAEKVLTRLNNGEKPATVVIP
jgi:hypothetical protein